MAQRSRAASSGPLAFLRIMLGESCIFLFFGASEACLNAVRLVRFLAEDQRPGVPALLKKGDNKPPLSGNLLRLIRAYALNLWENLFDYPFPTPALQTLWDSLWVGGFFVNALRLFMRVQH